MDMNYISEYGERGALLDLEKYGADVSKFAEGTVDSGKIDGKLVGINAGVNTPTILANPKIFEKAKMDMPDDMTWTWDEAAGASPPRSPPRPAAGSFGMSSIFNDALLSAFLRQNGKELFTPDGLGFEAADVVPWFDLMVSYEKAKAIPGAAQISEEVTQARSTRARLATGKAAMPMFWSNQVEARQRGRRRGDADPAVPEPGRQRHRAEGLVQGVDAVLGLGPDARTRRRPSRSSTGW